jgi:hypothetical protein
VRLQQAYDDAHSAKDVYCLQATEKLETPTARLSMSYMGYDSLYTLHQCRERDVRRDLFEVVVEHLMISKGRLAGDGPDTTTMVDTACSDHLPDDKDCDTS